MTYLRIHVETDAENLSVIQTQFDVRGLDYRFVQEDSENTVNYVEVAVKDVSEAFDVFVFFDIVMVNALTEEDLELAFPPEKIVVYPTPDWLKSIDLGYRILLLFGLPVLIFFGYLFWRTNHVETDDLIGHAWCVEIIVHQGKIIQPKTIDIPPLPGFKKFPKNCPEVLVFTARGDVEMPGFQTNPISGKWNKVSNKTLEIKDSQDFEEIYEGTYHIKRSWTHEIELVSPNTTFKLHK